MSMWSQSAPRLSMRLASEAKLAKSDDSIDGAIFAATPISGFGNLVRRWERDRGIWGDRRRFFTSSVWCSLSLNEYSRTCVTLVSNWTFVVPNSKEAALNLRNQNAVLRTQMLVLSKNARLIRMTEILVREWGWWKKGLVGLVKRCRFPGFLLCTFFFFFGFFVLVIFDGRWLLTELITKQVLLLY